MSYPKNRKIIYTVVRTEAQFGGYGRDGSITHWVNPVVLDSFRTIERAEERVGQFEQQFKEANIDEYFFEIQTSSYYDE